MTESLVDVALLAFGGPGSTQQIPDFLQRMTGRPANPETLKVVKGRNVPKGTVGTCIWYGEDKYSRSYYGAPPAMRVRILLI